MIDLTRLTPAQARAEMSRLAPKRHKYGAIRTTYRGQVYDSKAEAEYAAQLDLRKRAGAIVAWSRGAEYILLDGPKRRDRIAYRPDFQIWSEPYEPTNFYVVDVKGVQTAVFKLKAKLFKARYPRIPLVIVQKGGKEVRL